MLFFCGKLLSFYHNDVIINFWPCFSTRKREREQRLRIYKITSPKGKRKNARTNNLKQEEKIILKIKKQEQDIKTILNKDQVQGLKL